MQRIVVDTDALRLRAGVMAETARSLGEIGPTIAASVPGGSSGADALASAVQSSSAAWAGALSEVTQATNVNATNVARAADNFDLLETIQRAEFGS